MQYEDSCCAELGCSSQSNVHIAILSNNIIVNEQWYCEAHAKDIAKETLVEREVGSKIRSPVPHAAIAEVCVIMSWPAEQKNYIHLRERGSRRSYGFYCGPLEVSILLATLRSERPLRPLTHDLVIDVLNCLACTVRYVLITAHDNDPAGVFRASINIRTKADTYQIDARPTDAIAIATRSDAPILVDNTLLQSE